MLERQLLHKCTVKITQILSKSLELFIIKPILFLDLYFFKGFSFKNT